MYCLTFRSLINFEFVSVYGVKELSDFICFTSRDNDVRLTTRLSLGKLAAAKLLQSCPTLCDPIDGSPPGSPVPGILQARTLEWVAISFSHA